jgi:hypothetical protein
MTTTDAAPASEPKRPIHTPEQKTVYYMAIGDDSDYNENSKKDSLDYIATQFYGKKYVGQQTGEMMTNDSYYLYEVDDENIAQFEWDYHLVDDAPGPKQTYLGYHDGKSHYADGVNRFEYWQSLRWDAEARKNVIYVLPDRSNLAEALASQREPAEWEDARGHVFHYDFQVYRQAPEPRYVLYDLARNGVIPKGTYLLSVSW